MRNVSLSIEDGEPADRILASAERERGDTIIMGNRGLIHFAGLFLGSVSHMSAVSAFGTN